MAKRKQIAVPEPAPLPRVGDKVKRHGSNSVLEITQVYADGEVNLVLPEAVAQIAFLEWTGADHLRRACLRKR
jgi:hypothetical protein